MAKVSKQTITVTLSESQTNSTPSKPKKTKDPNKVRDPSKPTKPLCQGKCQDGKNCTNKVAKGNLKFCKIHGTQK